jgi:hypothetical protein
MNLKPIIKHLKDKARRGTNRENPSGNDTSESAGSGTRSPSPGLGVLGLVTHPFFSGPSRVSQKREVWPNLEALSKLLNQSAAFVPLRDAIDFLSWFVQAHEVTHLTPMNNLINLLNVKQSKYARKNEYKALRNQLEGLCNDLRDQLTKGTPSPMTTSVLNMCEYVPSEFRRSMSWAAKEDYRAVQTELREVYDTQDRSIISRRLQANQDMDRITTCYRCIYGHLKRVMVSVDKCLTGVHVA